MAVALQAIYTQTVGAGSPSTVTFNNIPQTFTDLKVLVSARSMTNDGGNTWRAQAMYFNADQSNSYSWVSVFATGVASFTTNQSATASFSFHWASSNVATANTFSNTEIYIPNYASTSIAKSVTIDNVSESNTQTAGSSMFAGYFSKTNAISSITFVDGGGFAQNTTITIYGIRRSGT